MPKKKSAKKQKSTTARKGVAKKKPTTKKSAKKKSAKKKASKKGKATREKNAATEPLEDVKQAGDLMFQAVELVMKAGTKEAKQLVNMAADMVKKIRD